MDEFEKGLFAEPYIHYASFNKGYNKALDDFAKWLVGHKIVDEDSMQEIIIDFNEEQLKADESE